MERKKIYIGVFLTPMYSLYKWNPSVMFFIFGNCILVVW